MSSWVKSSSVNVGGRGGAAVIQWIGAFYMVYRAMAVFSEPQIKQVNANILEFTTDES
jgi:hypothetical protein